jgi:hypothetical protein
MMDFLPDVPPAGPADEPLPSVTEQPGAPFDFQERFWLARPYSSQSFGEEVFRRWKEHVEQWTGMDPVSMAIWKAYRVYHSLSTPDATIDAPVISLVETGEQGEFLSLLINEYRSLVRQSIALVTSEDPAWEPETRTSDADGLRQVALCRNLLDYYMSAKRFDQKIKDAFELSEVTASGFVVYGWDANAGLRASGDVWGRPLTCWEVCHEKVRDYADVRHWIFLTWESRWDLVAQMAEHKPEQAKRLAEMQVDVSLLTGPEVSRVEELRDSDRIPVLNVYASASRACPHGRLAQYAAPDLPLIDGPMPYGPKAPIVRMCGAQYLGTAKPFANSWTQLPIMDALYVLFSSMMSRADHGAVGDVAVSAGTQFKQGDFGGFNLFRVPVGDQMPTLLDFLKIPDAIPKMTDMLRAAQERMAGMNSVTRGQPDANITSGSMAALIQSMAVQSNSASETAYRHALEESGDAILNIIQRMATEEQMISIAGQDQRYAAKTFRGEDLNQVMRVGVKATPPIMKTLGGKLDLADKALQRGMIQDPQQLLAAIATGNFSPVYRSAVDHVAIVKGENERLYRGEVVHAVDSDNHPVHIRDHACEFDTAARYDPAYAQRLHKHIWDEHFMLWAKMSREAPDMCFALGFDPLPQALAVGQALGMPGPATAGPPMQQMPGTAEQREPPGPAPQPPGQEQPLGGPRAPTPAKPPTTTQQEP